MNVINREQRIRELCRGKRVLDVGCCGDLLRNNGTGFLHAAIKQEAAEVVGLDYDPNAIKEAEKLGFKVIWGNAEQLESLGLGLFDVVTAGELVEHLANPGLFLQGANAILKPGGVIIITVPNAWSFTRLKQLRKGIDDELWTHEEHTCWYSKATIQFLVKRYGFTPAEIGFCGFFKTKRCFKRLRDFLRLGWAMKPEFSESIFLVATKQGAST